MSTNGITTIEMLKKGISLYLPKIHLQTDLMLDDSTLPTRTTIWGIRILPLGFFLFWVPHFYLTFILLGVFLTVGQYLTELWTDRIPLDPDGHGTRTDRWSSIVFRLNLLTFLGLIV